MRKHEKNGDMKARNELVPKFREMYRKTNFGFHVGDQVRCSIESKRKVYSIKRITKNNSFLIENVRNPVDKLFVPGTVLEKHEAGPEQLELFQEVLEC